MTDKQLRYIIKICPQTIECEEYIIKPESMHRCLLRLPQNITQSLIDYGKAWKWWCISDDLKRRFYKDIDFVEQKEEERQESFKEMKRLEKLIATQLREGKYLLEFDDNMKGLL